MSIENLVKIDIESEGANSEHDDNPKEELSAKSNNCNIRNQKYSDETEEVMICDSNSLDESLANESQPLLGGLDHHDGHQIIYNQFPSKCTIQFLDL